jgi:DNA-binding MarR family transcriptional regulator
LTTQVLADQAKLQTWIAFLRGHAGVTRRLNADLLAAHGLTLNDYEVLLHLARAPERALRRVDLSERVLLTQSGITRLLDGLERSGLVAKERCSTDGRVIYAKLTDAGYERLRAASKTHLAGIEALFTSRFSTEELDQLGRLLARLEDGGEPAPDCSVE